MYTWPAPAALRRPFRSTLIYTADGYFAHPTDVLPLVQLLCSKVHLLRHESLTVAEDCRVAAFAMFGVGLIRPFVNANARTALTFARQVLAKQRPGAKVDLHPDAHVFLSEAFSGLELLSPSAEHADLQALARRISMRVLSYNLTERSAQFEFVTQYLLQSYR